MTIAPLLDPVLRWLLRLRRRRRPSGVLLVSARGPAEMVFLSAVLARFMRLGRLEETVTLLCRPDAAGMSFLFPRFLRLRRIDFARLDDVAYRWKTFAALHAEHYRLVVSLDYVRERDRDEALILAADPVETAGMMPPPFKRSYAERLADSEKVFDILFDSGPLRQDKIVRWSRFADVVLEDEQPPQLALLPDNQLPQAERLAADTLVLFPFSGVRQRMLPVEVWRRLVEAIPATWQVLVAGHRDDFDRHPEMMGLMVRPNVRVEYAGFERLASLLMGTRLVVGVDTAGLHLAALLGTPTICLASSAYVGAGVPYDEQVIPGNVRFVHVPMECQGCLGRCRLPLENGLYPCVAAIDTDRVIETIAQSVASGVL